jgi:hypothetical protein
MAAGVFCVVIYIIIIGTMEAHIINRAQTTTSSGERFRTVLILGGIIVAIIVSIFLVNDAGTEGGTASILPHFATATQQLMHKSAILGFKSVSEVIAGAFNF